MSIPVEVDYANPDPSLNFTNLTDLIALLRLLTTAIISSDLGVYVISYTTPDVDDQDKLWQRLDSSGRPMGIYVYYGGRWVRNPPREGSKLGFFEGDPTGFFDSTGLGIPGGGDVALDFYGWAISNGQNGTADLSDQFIIGAKMTETDFGWNSGTGLWESNIEGSLATQGGNASHTLTDAETYQPAVAAIRAAHYMADGNTRDASGGMYGIDAGDGTGMPFDLVPAVVGNTSPDAVPIVPPYFAFALLSWVGYP